MKKKILHQAKQTRSFLMGMVTMLLIVSFAIPALAAYNQALTVTYNDIKIRVNGQYFTPKDVSGRVVEPFIYQGTTYLPIRGVAQAVGYTVNWDQATQTVDLSNGGNGSYIPPTTPSIPSTPVSTNLVDFLKPYAYSDDWDFKTYPSTGSESVAMGGNSYKNALEIEGYQYSNNFVSYNLGAGYTSLGGVLGIVDGTIANMGNQKGPQTVNIYGDGTLLKSIELSLGGLPVNFSVNVSGISELKFEVPGHFNAPTIGFANMKLS